MGLFGRFFGGDRRNKRLAAWAKTIPISHSQRLAMHELWRAGQKKNVPSIDPLAKFSEDDRAYILKICGADFRPSEFGSASTLRLSSWRYFKDIGFSEEQSAVLVGMLLNMVGRPDL